MKYRILILEMEKYHDFMLTNREESAIINNSDVTKDELWIKIIEKRGKKWKNGKERILVLQIHKELIP